MRRMVIVFAAILALLLAACGGGDDEGSGGDGNDSGVVVADESENDDGGEELTINDIDGDAEELSQTSGGEGEEGDGADDGSEELTIDEFEGGESGSGNDDGERIEVAENEEDPIDSLLNSLTAFNSCVSDEGYDVEQEGLPGPDGTDIADFDPDYVAVLGSCANSSGIIESFQKIGEANSNLTGEEIRERNFGYPVFVECMERKGWDLGELEPDENGLLSSTQFEPPDGGSLMAGTGDINECRKEIETYVEENYEGSEG